jgi:hypothetical protein
METTSWEPDAFLDSPHFKEIEDFFPVFRSLYRLSIPEPDESSPHPQSYFFQINFHIILLPTPRYFKWISFFDFLSKPLHAFSFSPICVTCPAYYFLLDFVHPIPSEEYKPLSSFIAFLLTAFLSSLLLRPKYNPQHPILEHHQTVFWCGRSSFKPISNTRKSYNYVCFNICISR